MAVMVAPEVQVAARSWLTAAVGEGAVPAKPPRYESKEGSQEAHEAIRPTDPAAGGEGIDPEHAPLYDLIRRGLLGVADDHGADPPYDLEAVGAASFRPAGAPGRAGARGRRPGVSPGAAAGLAGRRAAVGAGPGGGNGLGAGQCRPRRRPPSRPLPTKRLQSRCGSCGGAQQHWKAPAATCTCARRGPRAGAWRSRPGAARGPGVPAPAPGRRAVGVDSGGSTFAFGGLRMESGNAPCFWKNFSK